MLNVEYKIVLQEYEKIVEFVENMKYIKGDVDVFSANNRYIVDGKSVIGVFSLDLSKPITAKLISDDKEDIEKFKNYVEQYSLVE